MIILEITTEESDWVIGPSRKAIIEWYCNYIGCTEDELDIEEVYEKEWPRKTIIDFDIVYDEEIHGDDEDDYNAISSLAEEAKKWKSGVHILASTKQE
jgi:hypothetical protein